MKLQSFSSRLLSPLLRPLLRARYFALVLPLFALFSTAHAGCSSGTYGYGSGASGQTTTPAPCAPTSYGGYGGYGNSGGCD